MGVPRFYKWLSERYPLINRKIGSDSRFLPHFDNFYLDLNGIIHNCSHPDDTDDSLSKVLTFETICANMEVLIDKMVQTVRPRHVLFIAVDGCAPRAKLNQQRSRRFATARNNDRIKETLRKERGASELIEEESFDSNVITPGTKFMADLHNFLQRYIRAKIESDPIWRNLRVIYSGHDVPGEGEHKIMNFIRSERRNPNYDPNTRHCCNSLDADLIMLGLATHEPRFCLLREEVDFTGGRDPKASLKTKEYSSLSTDLENWELLDLSTLRQYLKLEFDLYHNQEISSRNLENIKKPCIERIIDDIIVLISVIGNDFLPHLPGVEIRVGSLDRILALYKNLLYQNLPSFNYIVSNDDFSVQLPNLFQVFKLLAEDEVNHFEGNSKRKSSNSIASYKEKYYKRNFGVDYKTGENVDQINKACRSFIEGIIWCFKYYFFGVPSWEWYYPFHYAPLASDLTNFQRMKIKRNESSVRTKKDNSNNPVVALMQMLNVKAPKKHNVEENALDLNAPLSDIEIKEIIQSLNSFNLSKPLEPFLQLMCCLPPQSAKALPLPFGKLMSSRDSPLHEFYPLEFVTDLNGKKYEYQGVNLIPFVDLEQIKNIVSKSVDYSKLTKDELFRNRVGNTLDFQLKANGRISERKVVFPPKVDGIVHLLGSEDFVKEGKFAGDPNLLGLRTDTTKCKLEKINLHIFNRPSQEESFVLNVSLQREIIDFTEEIAKRKSTRNNSNGVDTDITVHTVAAYLNNLVKKNRFRKLRCWVNLPYFIEAEIYSVYSKEGKYNFKSSPGRRVTKSIQAGFVRDHSFSNTDINFDVHSDKITSSLHFGCGKVGSGGFEIEDDFFDMFVEVVPKSSIRYDYKKQTFHDIFGGKRISLPMQLIAFKNSAGDEQLKANYYNKIIKDNKNLSMVLGKSNMTEQFMVLNDELGCYGLVGEVVSEHDNDLVIRVDVPSAKVLNFKTSFGHNIAKNITEKYYSTNYVSRQLQVSTVTIGKIASSIFVKPGRFDFGLNLKGRKQYKTAGFTRGSNNYAQRTGFEIWKEKQKCIDVHGLSKVLQKSKKVDDNTNKSKSINFYWEYSEAAINIFQKFKEEYPQLFNVIDASPDEFEYDLDDLLPSVIESSDGDMETVSKEERIEGIKAFLKCLPCYNNPLVPVESDFLNQTHIQALLHHIKKGNIKQNAKTCEISIPKSGGVTLSALKCQLWFDSPTSQTIPRLGDRVVNMTNNNIEFGKPGYIIATHPLTKCVEVLFDDGRKLVVKYSQVINQSQPRYINYANGRNPSEYNEISPKRTYAQQARKASFDHNKTRSTSTNVDDMLAALKSKIQLEAKKQTKKLSKLSNKEAREKTILLKNIMQLPQNSEDVIIKKGPIRIGFPSVNEGKNVENVSKAKVTSSAVETKSVKEPKKPTITILKKPENTTPNPAKDKKENIPKKKTTRKSKKKAFRIQKKNNGSIQKQSDLLKKIGSKDK